MCISGTDGTRPGWYVYCKTLFWVVQGPKSMRWEGRYKFGTSVTAALEKLVEYQEFCKNCLYLLHCRNFGRCFICYKTGVSQRPNVPNYIPSQNVSLFSSEQKKRELNAIRSTVGVHWEHELPSNLNEARNPIGSRDTTPHLVCMSTKNKQTPIYGIVLSPSSETETGVHRRRNLRTRA